MPQAKSSVIKVRAVMAMPRILQHGGQLVGTLAAGMKQSETMAGPRRVARRIDPVSHRRPWWAGVVAAGCLGSASG